MSSPMRLSRNVVVAALLAICFCFYIWSSSGPQPEPEPVITFDTKGLAEHDLSFPANIHVNYPDESHLHADFDRHAVYELPPDPEDYIALWNLRSKTFDNQTIIITVVNMGHLNMTLNCIESIRRQGRLDNFFVFCLVPEVCDVLHAIGVNGAVIPENWSSVGMQQGMEGGLSDEAKFGTNKRYLSITYTKQVVVWRLLKAGFRVIFTDADIVWVKPGVTDYLSEILKKNEHVDYAGSLDYSEKHFLAPYVNSGFYIVRPTPLMDRFFELLVANQLKGPKIISQHIFNKGLDVLGMKTNGRNSHKAHYLNPLLFCNGMEYFHMATPQKLSLIPYTVHPNYMIGKENKEKSLKKSGLWYIDSTTFKIPKIEAKDDEED